MDGVNSVFDPYYSTTTWVVLSIFFVVSIAASLTLSTCVLFQCSWTKFREFRNIKHEFRWEDGFHGCDSRRCVANS